MKNSENLIFSGVFLILLLNIFALFPLIGTSTLALVIFIGDLAIIFILVMVWVTIDSEDSEEIAETERKGK